MCNGEPRDVDDHSSNIRGESYYQDKFPKFKRSPCAFQVFSAIKDCRACDDEGEDILLGKGGSKVHPRVEDGVLRNEDEEFGVASDELAGELVDKGDHEENGKEDARGGGDADANLHDEKSKVFYVPMFTSSSI